MSAGNANVTTLTDTTFDEEVAGTAELVLVDFWAEWCGPCKRIAPVLNEIAGSHAGRLRIAKLNVDENPVTPQRFNVMSIPTLIVFRGGLPVKRLVGAMSKPKLLESVGDLLE